MFTPIYFPDSEPSPRELSVAMMLKYTFKEFEASKSIEDAVKKEFMYGNDSQ